MQRLLYYALNLKKIWTTCIYCQRNGHALFTYKGKCFGFITRFPSYRFKYIVNLPLLSSTLVNTLLDVAHQQLLVAVTIMSI